MILNLTQHAATPDQKNSGVVDLAGNNLLDVKSLLTFETIPSKEEIQERASLLAEFAATYDVIGTEESGCEVYATSALIGGAPFFMSALEKELKMRGVQPLYAFSMRESIEVCNDDGSVIKQNVFRHKGFIEV